MDIRPIDANALEGRLDTINPVDYGSMGSYEAHAGAREALSDARMLINDAPTLSLNTLRDAIYQDAVEHGLWSDKHTEWPIECAEMINNEVDELLCAGDIWEDDGVDLEDPNVHYCEELADVIIMSMSVAGKLDIDIDAAIRRKMEINKQRPWKHGKE